MVIDDLGPWLAAEYTAVWGGKAPRPWVPVTPSIRFAACGWRCGLWLLRAYVVPIVLISGQAITARNLLRGVKRRAEAIPAGPSAEDLAPCAVPEGRR
jgi:hypothetical protein